MVSVKESWHLQMPIEYNARGDVIHWLEGERNFSSRESAEFAMLTAERTMKNCGFDITFNLVHSFNHR